MTASATTTTTRVDAALPAARPQRWGLSYLLLAGLALGWGFNFPILKLGLESSPPLLFTTIRMALGMLTMFVIVALCGKLKLPHRRDLPVVLSVGILQNMMFIALLTVALQFLPASRAVIMAYTTPLWVVPAAVLFLGERFTPGRLLGVVAGMGGLLLVINPLSFDWQQPDTFIGVGLILLATFIWTTGVVHVRRHHWHGEVLELIPWQILLSVVILAPVALWLESPAEIHWSSTFVWQLLYSGTVASGLCVAAQVLLILSMPAVSMSLGSAAIPAVGLITSAWILKEQPAGGDIGGFVLIAIGIVVLGLSDRRQKACS